MITMEMYYIYLSIVTFTIRLKIVNLGLMLNIHIQSSMEWKVDIENIT